MSEAKDSFADFESHIKPSWKNVSVTKITLGCEVSTWNPKTKKGGIGIVTRIHKSKTKVEVVSPHTQKVCVIPVDQITCVAKTPKDTYLAYSGSGK